MTLDNYPVIKLGDYVIIQRQKYTKLHKFGNLESTAMLGKEQLELGSIVGHKYDSTFKMIPKDGKKRQKTSNILEICSETDMRSMREVLGITESGVDNRNIVDDGGSHGLKREDIDKLKEECTASSQLIEKIVESSKTFMSKTEYSQEKYLKKKERKYFEYVQIKQPSVRLLAEIYYRQDADKIMGLRMDTLSQIISYSGISGFGNFLLYESGSCGLLPAALMNSIGAGTEANLVHMHPGNVPQKQAVLALNLPEEQMNRCISVNIYSVLREYYQNDQNSDAVSKTLNIELDDGELCKEPAMVEIKTDQQNKTDKSPTEASGSKRQGDILPEDEVPSKRFKPEETENGNGALTEQKEPPKWQLENQRASALMREKFDSLVIVAREHPSTIIKALLPFLKPSRPIVIFNLSKEILMEIYVDLKTSSEITGLHLSSNWLRMYQILPNRTHPEVNMSGNSGFLLHGYSVN